MMYIGTDQGLYRWRPGTPWPVFHSLQGRPIVDVDSPGGGTLVAVDAAGRIFESVNNGQDWDEVAPPPGGGRPTAMALEGLSGSMVLATRPLGLFRRPLGPDPAEADVGALSRADRRVVDLFDRAVRLVRRGRRAESGGTAVAEPPPAAKAPAPPARLRGGRWEVLTVPPVEHGPVAPTLRTIVPGPQAWFAAVAGAGLWRSEDGGQSWSRCEGLPAEVYAVRTAPKPEGRVAVATADGCYVSDDGGRTWQDRSGGLEGVRHLRALEIKPGKPDVMLAGAAPVGAADEALARRGGLRFSLYETKDGGKTWAHMVRGFPDVLEYDAIADIRYDPEDTEYAVVALASGELWSTRTDGLWWEPLARMINSARVLCPVG